MRSGTLTIIILVVTKLLRPDPRLRPKTAEISEMSSFQSLRKKRPNQSINHKTRRNR